MARPIASAVFVVLMCTTGSALGAAPSIPACRIDRSLTRPTEQAVARATALFGELGRALPFTTFAVNPPSLQPENVLAVYVVRDATVDRVDRSGCPRSSSSWTDGGRPDNLSVRGGCYVAAERLSEIRCSARALRAFAGAENSSRPASPALLYVIAHELAHLHQGRRGEFTGKLERIRLAQPRTDKLEHLRRACDPALITREEEADAIAREVLTRAMPQAPYREPLLTERGSVYWNIDRIRLAANEWEQWQMKEDATESVKLHPAFEPAEFPTPPVRIARAADRFVCDVLSGRTGEALYPARQTTHPAPEQRLRRVSEALKPVADALPETGCWRT
jgi:hypothetical protein